ncbi:MAG: protease, partial [Nanoarchaeota archaeon]
MLNNKKVLIFAENFYEDLELWYPKIRLTEEGAKVV